MLLGRQGDDASGRRWRPLVIIAVGFFLFFFFLSLWLPGQRVDDPTNGQQVIAGIDRFDHLQDQIRRAVGQKVERSSTMVLVVVAMIMVIRAVLVFVPGMTQLLALFLFVCRNIVPALSAQDGYQCLMVRS
jgi:hypothetical protein